MSEEQLEVQEVVSEEKVPSVLTLDGETAKRIRSSMQSFSLDSPLTNKEILLVRGTLNVMDSEIAPRTVSLGVELKDMEEDERVPRETVPPSSEDDYNSRYAYFIKCQALVALKEFKEGWQAFEDLILKPYVLQRRRDNVNYREDDRDKAFALRLKQQSAEDFFAFIMSQMAEAANVARPVKADT